MSLRDFTIVDLNRLLINKFRSEIRLIIAKDFDSKSKIKEEEFIIDILNQELESIDDYLIKKHKKWVYKTLLESNFEENKIKEVLIDNYSNHTKEEINITYRKAIEELSTKIDAW